MNLTPNNCNSQAFWRNFFFFSRYKEKWEICAPNQARFRPGCGYADQITLRTALEHRLSVYNLPQCINDFATAFDTIDRAVLWGIMQHNSVSEKIIKFVKAFYGSAYAYMCNKTDTTFWNTHSACAKIAFSLLQFPTLAINWIMDNACRHSRGV